MKARTRAQAEGWFPGIRHVKATYRTELYVRPNQIVRHSSSLFLAETNAIRFPGIQDGKAIYRMERSQRPNQWSDTFFYFPGSGGRMGCNGGAERLVQSERRDAHITHVPMAIYCLWPGMKDCPDCCRKYCNTKRIYTYITY